MTTITTFRDLRIPELRREAEAAELARRTAQVRAELQAQISAYLVMHPQIGILMRQGRPMYYVTTDYRKGTIVEARDPRELPLC